MNRPHSPGPWRADANPDGNEPKHLTLADFEPTHMWAADPHCPFCGRQFCVAPAMSKYDVVLNVCVLCNSQWEAPK